MFRFAKGRIQRSVSGMGTAEEIKAAIGQLPLEERAALIAELCGWADDDWDRQMKPTPRPARFLQCSEQLHR